MVFVPEGMKRKTNIQEYLAGRQIVPGIIIR